MSSTITLLSGAGSVLAFAGSVLVASQFARRRSVGFLLFLIANALMVVVMASVGLWPVMSLYLAFTGTAGWGLHQTRALIRQGRDSV
jgi:hypothetical protein